MSTETDTKPRHLPPAARVALEPFDSLFGAMYEALIARLAEVEDLDSLEAACGQVSQSNCWWVTYQTAHLLLPEIRSERNLRARRGPNEGGTDRE